MVCGGLSGGLSVPVSVLRGFVLVSNKDMVVAVGVLAACAVWKALRLRESWGVGRELSDCEDFFASLRPPVAVDVSGQVNAGCDEERDKQRCSVCRSSASRPLQKLPCEVPYEAKHLVCAHCLARLHAARGSICPFCHLPLCKLPGEKTYRTLRKAVLACAGAHQALYVIGIALQVAQGWYTYAAVDIAVALAFYRSTRLCLEVSVSADGGYRNGGLLCWLVVLAGFTLWAAWWIEPFDQATFVDGEWVVGLRKSMEYSFSCFC